MLLEASFHGGMGFSDLVLHALDETFGVGKLLLGLVELVVQVNDGLVQVIDLSL